MEEQTLATRKMAKYNDLLMKALYITDEQAKESTEANASKADISYIVKNYSTIDDSAIVVSNSEIKDYYNKNQKKFEQEESRKIVYVNFDIEPSGEDYVETEKAVKELVDEFTETNDPIDFVSLSSSDTKADRNYYKKKKLQMIAWPTTCSITEQQFMVPIWKITHTKYPVLLQ